MGKNMWKFDFNRGHEFQARDNYGKKYDTKWDKLNFSAIIQQGNFLHRGEQGLFESVGFKLFNLAGIESPNTNYVHFRIVENGSEVGDSQFDTDFQGIYLAIEQLDGNFLDEHALPDGNLYKMESGTGTLTNQGATQPTDRSDLDTFLDTYNNTTPTEQWWRNNLDLEKYYSYRSIVEGIHHYDIAAGKNYFYFHNPETGKWQVHPWDLDLTWANNMFGSGNEPFKSRVTQRTEFEQEYRNRLRELRDLLYNSDQVDILIDEMASFVYTSGEASLVDADRAMWDYNPILTSSYVRSNKAGHGRFYESSATDDFAGMLQLMKDYVQSRGAWIDSTLLTDAAVIPNTPTISYSGPAGFPVNRLEFSTTSFSGSGSFAGMEWRIAEVTDPTSHDFDPTKRRHYEIEADWESGAIATFSPAIAIPAERLKVGKTYRARVRMQDDAGRYSHWSAPVQFIAGIESGRLEAGDIQINEILAHSNGVLGDWIELHNTKHEDIDISGWYLSDTDTDLSAYEIPAGTILPAGGYVVLNETDHFGTSFALSELGETLYLTNGLPDGSLGDYREQQSFGATPADVSIGRYVNPDGDQDFRILSYGTANGRNAPPRVGPVVINELMYNPASGNSDDEYIELLNIMPTETPLFDSSDPMNTWTFGDGVAFTFPTDITIAAHEHILVTGTDPDVFRAAHSIDPVVRIFGPWTGSLSNGGESVELFMPGTPESDGFVPAIRVDKVEYNDNDPWPASADGDGPSLSRLVPFHYGNDVSNWRASKKIGGSPGASNTVAADATTEVIGRHLFYNDSHFDGGNSEITPSDDLAIAVEKLPLLPGNTAQFVNYVSYTHGINGVVIDVLNLADPTSITFDDFVFRVGNSDDIGSWAINTTATKLAVRPQAGSSYSDRIMVGWDNAAIRGEWLEVTIKATAATGLSSADTFYYGSAVGDAGDSIQNAMTTSSDFASARDNQISFVETASIQNVSDYNRDGLVNSFDMMVARDNETTLLTTMALIMPTSPGGSAAVSAPMAVALSMTSPPVIIETHTELASQERPPIAIGSTSQLLATVADFREHVFARIAANHPLDRDDLMAAPWSIIPEPETWDDDLMVRV